jgi:hypothetical protein
MAATTGQLGLVTPTQGTLAGTWGDSVNNGITEYTNIAIAGTLTLTGDGAVTLANTTGDASASNITSTLTGAGTVTAQFAIVRVTGTLTVAKVVTGPSYSKTYTVVNAATGGIVTFKASGQTGVSVAVGESAFVYFNGTDYVKLVGTATAGAAGGSNTQVQFNSSGILSGSSSLTWDGTTLSSTQVNITGQGTLRLQDTTGGEYVGLRSPSALGASYTLTFPADDGTSGQALITDGSGGLSWSTAASGDVYGPGSSTDNAVARFDSTTGKLLQNSVVLIGDTGAVTGVTDLSASGSVTLSGGTANGVTYLNGSKVLTSGSALTFDGTRLGIGTASPDSLGLLTTEVNGNSLNISRTASTTGRAGWFSQNTAETIRLFSEVYGASATNTGFGLTLAGYGVIQTQGTASNGLIIGTGTNDPLIFGQNNTEGMRLTSTGLGIGTSSPVAPLHVYRASSSSVRIDTDASTSSTQLNFAIAGTNKWSMYRPSSSNDLRMFDNATAIDVMTWQVGGNVGIGTSSPTVALDVVGQIKTSGSSFSSPNIQSSGVLRIGTTAAEDVRFGTNSTERMRLDSAGNLGLGVTPSAWAVYKSFDSGSCSFNTAGVQGELTSNGFFNASSQWIYKATGFANRYVQNLSANGVHAWFNAASGTAGNAITFTQAMTLDANGDFGLGTTSIAAAGKTIHVNSSTADACIRFTNSSSGATVSDGFKLQINSGDAYLVNYETGFMAFYTSGTERARITSTGDFLVGTTTTNNFGGTVVQTLGSSGIVDVSSASVAQNGTVNLTASSAGNSFTGFLSVTNFLLSNGNIRTQSLYAIMGRGTNFTATQLGTANGTTGGASFTVTCTTTGVITVTNTYAGATQVNMTFTGHKGG